VVLGAVSAYVVTRSSGQPQVSADVLPVVASAAQTAVYVDCSKIDAVAFDPHNPCQTFVLPHSDHFTSAAAFLDAEARQLRAVGWGHPRIAPPVDYDGGGEMANLGDSWFAPGHKACLYLATVQAGVAAEARVLFPYDPYNQPQGVLDFYRTAKSAKPSQTLWARLRSPKTEVGAC
jgi:hypothetical protein